MENKTLVIECSDNLAMFLDALLESGLFGPSRDTCAQRLLELKCFEMSMSFAKLTGFPLDGKK